MRPTGGPTWRRGFVVAVAVGFAVGMATSPLQGWLADSVGSLANSAGPWCLAVFLVARRARRATGGAVLAAITLATCEIGYVVATQLRGDSSSRSTVAFWLTAALLAGPPLGVAAVWSRSARPWCRAVGFGVLGGVLVGEALYGLAEISDTTDWRYWTVELVIGAGIVILGTVAAAGSARAAALAALVATAVAGVVYSAATLA